MAITNMTVKQAKPIIDAVLANINGGSMSMTATPADYVSAATTIKSHDMDQVMGAITQMWGRTIEAVRPYSGMLQPLIFDTDGWSMATRKINFVSRLPSNNQAWDYPVTRDDTETSNPLGDGLSVDMYRINKDKVLETAFYGAETWATHRTTFVDQLRPAFDDPEDLVRFNSAAVQHVQNDRETWAEAFIRGVLIAALQSAAASQTHTVHLVTEYAALTGEAAADILADPAIYAEFTRWMYGRIAAIKMRMRERNTMYTTQPANLPQGLGILRHTPSDRLRMMMIGERLEDIRARVLSTTYNEELLNLGDVTPITYWQNPDSPMAVSPATGSTAIDGIMGIMFDRDALGVAPVQNKVYTTPINADGEYYNTFFKTVWKNRLDLSEKFVVLKLD